MKQVLHIFLCFMISFGLAREDILLQEDGTPASQKVSRQYDQPSKKADTYDQGIQNFPAALKYPYIDSKCCNLSTTDRCSRFGNDGFRGHCMPRNETCHGTELFGSRYCIISKHQSCKCCIPRDCPRHTLSPCAKLNGSCIGLRDHCNGTSVVSEEFCRRDSKTDSCKCCFPLVTKQDCPCGQNHDGICLGSYPRGHVADGKEAKGRCMETCDTGHTALIDNTCNKTGGMECKCCDIYDYCGTSCESPNPTSCMCMINGDSCPKGHCSHSDADMCPEGSCACCRDKPTECRSKLEQCSAPNDYCVEKMKGDCPEGYSKVHDACITPKGDGKYEDKDCDCCKSLECSSIDDRCTGRGSFCVDYRSACPKGYAESLDCAKPIIVNGTVIGKRRCKCCKPISVGLQEVDIAKNGGIAKASSSHVSGNYGPMNAFGDSGFWHSHHPYTVPQSLWVEFDNPLRIIKYSFTSRPDHYARTDGPSKYIFWASNYGDCTEESHWVTLKEDNSGTPFTDSNDPKEEPIENENFYSCYGFKVNDVPGRPNEKPVTIGNIRLFSN